MNTYLRLVRKGSLWASLTMAFFIFSTFLSCAGKISEPIYEDQAHFQFEEAGLLYIQNSFPESTINQCREELLNDLESFYSVYTEASIPGHSDLEFIIHHVSWSDLASSVFFADYLGFRDKSAKYEVVLDDYIQAFLGDIDNSIIGIFYPVINTVFVRAESMYTSFRVKPMRWNYPMSTSSPISSMKASRISGHSASVITDLLK